MEKKRYKILVLSDLKNSSETILKTTANLAKSIGGDIDLLHVKKPIDIVENDNQLSSMRTINRDYLASKDHIDNIIKSVDKSLNINYSLIYGNVKQEIKAHIDTIKPDVIVLGKKRYNALKLAGDKVTKFVLKKYKGIILIASNDEVLEPNENLSLGVLNNFKPNDNDNKELVKSIIAVSEKPIKSFKISKSGSSELIENDSTLDKTIEYVFEPSSNSINNLSNYVAKNEIDLLYISRKKNDSKVSQVSSNININNIINKVNVSLLLTM